MNSMNNENYNTSDDKPISLGQRNHELLLETIVANKLGIKSAQEKNAEIDIYDAEFQETMSIEHYRDSIADSLIPEMEEKQKREISSNIWYFVMGSLITLTFIFMIYYIVLACQGKLE